MISINTNLSSLIAQNSLKISTNKLNETVERMSTGYKINHAKDNAANYSISTNMTTKLGAYQVAEDNTAMGLDMVTTASENLSLIEDKLTRLRSLATQAQNGTYGTQSLNAMQEEANSLTKELQRLYETAKFNGVKLLDDSPEIPDGIGLTKDLTPKYDGFIENPYDYTSQEVSNMTKLETIDENTTISNGQYSISSDDELAKLARMVNNGKVTGGEFVLARDIDLSEYSDGEGWTPIGITESKGFRGQFNGNGHKITGLKINRPDAELQGLFGFTHKSIKNLAIEDCDIIGGNQTGALVGSGRYNYVIENCYTTGEVLGKGKVGGVVGFTYGGEVKNCHSSVNVEALLEYGAGGLVGQTQRTAISNSFATGDVVGASEVGGFVGHNSGTLVNCYATGNITAVGSSCGGLAGTSTDSQVLNCYATGDITSKNSSGGLLGGMNNSSLKNCYSTGDIIGNGNYNGGLIASCSLTTDSIIENVRAYGNITATSCSGGLIGRLINKTASLTIKNAVTYSKFSEPDIANTKKSGSFIGINQCTDDETVYGTLITENCGALSQGMNMISGCYKLVGGGFQSITYNMTDMLAGIKDVYEPKQSITLQVGINSGETSSISFNSKIEHKILKGLKKFDITSKDSFDVIDNLLLDISEKQTQLGATQNRLESALDEISTQYDNLVSSRLTLRDADMAELSSTYIQQQILQEASATLMATANQMPAIALQLL